MNKYLTSLALAALSLGLVAAPVSAVAAPAKKPGNLVVYDDGKLFTAAGIDKAQGVLSGAEFDHGLTVTVDTFAEIPEGKKAEYTDAKKAQFFKNWANELAKGDRAKGIFVLVCRKPGYIEVIADKETRDRGFTNENEQKLKTTLLESFSEAAKHKDDAAKQGEIRDNGLKAAAEYIVGDLKGTTVVTHATTNTKAAKPAGESFMSKYGGMICIGFVALLGVWLVIGVIRALTGGGGGGGQGGGGQGGGQGGGGGGGGGFMTSMLGGMFGAAAGMWMYSHFMGGSSMMGGGSDAYAGDSSSAADADTGAGDFSGDQGAGGSFDDAGDAGGGGGDWGGGGDFDGGGGGGGDF